MSLKYTSYKELLEYSLEQAGSFSLVWRNCSYNKSAFILLEKLEPWLISDYKSSSWPGTVLCGEKARVMTYEVNNQTICLLNCVDSVFEWQAPNFPEDLAFYRGKDLLFGSIAHEGEAWFTT